MTPTYIAVPIAQKRKLPPSLIGSFQEADCDGCGGRVFYHRATFSRWLATTRCVGKKLRIVCDRCGERTITTSTRPIITVAEYDPKLAKHFNRG